MLSMIEDMSNRIYPVTKEQLDSGQYTIVRSYDVPQNYPKIVFQDKPFGREIDDWDQNVAVKQLTNHIRGYACQLIANKFDVTLREVMEGVKEASENMGPANLYSDEVFHLIQEATR